MKLTFIDPMYNPVLLDYIQTKNVYKQCPVYKFCTLLMYGKPLDNLEPNPAVLDILRGSTTDGDSEVTRRFDTAYAGQILTNHLAFIDLMTLMHSFQESNEVFVSCNYKNEHFVPIIDSLIKFIQERYTVRSFIVQERDDINELSTSDFELPEGYQNFVSDFSIFASRVYTKDQLSNFTTD